MDRGGDSHENQKPEVSYQRNPVYPFGSGNRCSKIYHFFQSCSWVVKTNPGNRRLPFYRYCSCGAGILILSILVDTFFLKGYHRLCCQFQGLIILSAFYHRRGTGDKVSPVPCTYHLSISKSLFCPSCTSRFPLALCPRLKAVVTVSIGL